MVKRRGRKLRRFLFACFCFGPALSGQGAVVRALNPVEEKVLDLVEPVALDLGLRIVRVRLSGNRRKRLQIMAERAADHGMGVEDCEALSRAISPVLEAADPVAGEYDLEVSSPGIDRPLMNLEDFTRFIGFEAKVETAGMIEGRRRFKGVVAAVEGLDIVLNTVEGPEKIPFSALSDARLVLTDALLAKELKRAEAEQAARDAEEKSIKNQAKALKKEKP